MHAEHHERQAAAFMQWHGKLDAHDWRDAFGRWADGKDFAPADRLAIRSIVLGEFVASGETSPTHEDAILLREAAHV